jgi:cytochrome P450
MCGYDLPAGTWLLVPGCALDRSIAVYGEDADDFRPDRWLSRSSDTGGKDGAGIAWAGTGAYDGDDAGGDAAASVQGRLWAEAGRRAMRKHAHAHAALCEPRTHAHACTPPCRHRVCAGRLKEPIAFSMGPRDCVGQALARLDAQVFLAMLFSRFRVSLAPGMGSPEEIWSKTAYHVTLTMPDGLWLCMEAR